MFIHCTDKFAILAATRCGHTNMYHYFAIDHYSHNPTNEVFTWREHQNSIVVLRNPLDRVFSAMMHPATLYGQGQRELFFVNHSSPYMNDILTGCNFRIIDFYDLEQYIPRTSDAFQSPRTYSRIDDATKAEDVYVANKSYSLQALQTELKIYKELMVSCERVSVEEWKKLTM